MQAESRLQLEQANRTHLERAAEALAQRRERVDAERQALAEPDSGAMRELEERVAEIDASLEAARHAFETLQAQCAALQEASAQAAESVGVAQREHAAAEAQLSTLRQIQAEAQSNVPLQEWLERHGLGAAAQLWQKLRIDAGWETAVEAVLRERLHALQSGSIDTGFSERPPVKASLFEASRDATTAPAAGLPLASKVHVLDEGIRGALADWLTGVFIAEGRPSASMRARPRSRRWGGAASSSGAVWKVPRASSRRRKAGGWSARPRSRKRVRRSRARRRRGTTRRSSSSSSRRPRIATASAAPSSRPSRPRDRKS